MMQGRYRIEMRVSLVLILGSILLAGCDATGIGNNDDKGGTGVSYEGGLFDASPSDSCQDHLTAGNPGFSDQILCREGYAVGYNYSTKLANWVQYRITADSVSARVDRADNFREDQDLPVSFRATLSDYAGSGYDRGHLAPNATMDFSVISMDESFLLSNIAPQLPGFNRDGWADLEQYVRDCTVEKGELIVATGPVFNSAVRRTLGSGVAIPDAYYKVILKPGSPATGFAFRIPHSPVSESELEDYVTSIDDVEAATGIDFFAAVRDDVENPVEASATPVCALPWKSAGSGNGGNSGGGFGACGSKTRCGQMSSCAEAYYFLNACGRRSLDRDKDGVPCESICR